MKKIIIAALAAFVVGFGITYYVLNKPHRDVAGEEATHTLKAQALFDAFEMDETASNAKYLDQIVQVSGTISAISKSDSSSYVVALLEGVACGMDISMNQEIKNLSEGQQVKIKGLCTGYDGILEVKLSKCTIE